MNRKILTVLLVTMACIMMTACGKAPEVQVDDYISDGPAIAEEAPASYDTSDEPAAEATRGELYQEEPESEKTEDAASGIEGIITLVAYPDTSGYYCFEVAAVDPANLSSRQILSLRLSLIESNQEYGYLVPLDNPRFGNFQDQFSPDFSRMAATRMRISDRSMHCGWVDKSGEFFDVTEALGEAEASGSDTPVHYQAIGFMDNGETFVYEKVNDLNAADVFETIGYYAVSVDNIEPGTSWVVSPSIPYMHNDDSWGWLGDYMPSDWIDATHFYADTGSQTEKDPCVIVDIETQTVSELISGELSENWGVVASPDGQQIALMSRFRNGILNTAGLYVRSLDNLGYDRSVGGVGSIGNGRSSTIYGRATNVDVFCTVLDWR